MSEPILPELIIRCPSWTEEETATVREYLLAVLGRSSEYEILPSNLESVIVAEQYNEEYKAISDRFGLLLQLTNEAEYISGIKLCSNQDPVNPLYILLVNAQTFYNGRNVENIINTILLKNVAETLLPVDLRIKTGVHYVKSTKDIATSLFPYLFESVYARIRLSDENGELKEPAVELKNLLAPFRRTVKRLHLKYQSDNDIDVCATGYLIALRRFLIGIADNLFLRSDISELGDFAEVIQPLMQGLLHEAFVVVEGKQPSVDFLDKGIADIAALCYFRFLDGGGLEITETPKKLFPDLIDTHNRIVGFVDLLGFSNLVQQYDREENILILRDLKEALDLAIHQMQTTYQVAAEHMECKLFSDCLCISVPYFEDGKDFAYQFGGIMLALTTYQSLLLQKGHLVRGGITAGSYYSDTNMIFSGALVRAVDFEKCGNTKNQKTDYRPPRIIVDPTIIDALDKDLVHLSIRPHFDAGLIRDRDGEVFISPIVSLNASRQIFDIVTQLTGNATAGPLQGAHKTLQDMAESIKLFLSPGMENITLTELIKTLDRKITEYTGKPFVGKYEWAKEFVQWEIDNRTGHRFTVCIVEFKGEWKDL